MNRNTKPSVADEKRRKTDWDAIERDYRTDHFTLRQLESKHGISYAQISRKAKAQGWKKDLRKKIKDATDEALLQESVTNEQKSVTATVAVAVETNLQVIRSHKSLLGDLAEDMRSARRKLNERGSEVTDIREAATYVQAVGHLAGATKTLIEQERKAFGLDDREADSDNKLADALKTLMEMKKNGITPGAL